MYIVTLRQGKDKKHSYGAHPKNLVLFNISTTIKEIKKFLITPPRQLELWWANL